MNARRASLGIVLVLCLFAQIGSAAAPTDLFFSEYIEGSSNNKAVEIYNGTSAAVDLAAQAYKLEIYFNGATTASFSLALTGTIAPGGTFVVAPTNANSTILAAAQQTSGTAWFNGDDAVVLKHGATIIDVIGQIGFRPVNYWGTGSVTTQDHTLRRKASVCSGDANGTDAFDPTAEWDGFPIDTFSGLGTHTASCGSGNQTNPALTGNASPSTVQPGGTTLLTVNVTPGQNPASTQLAVVADLSSIGGSNAQSFISSGTTFTFNATVALGSSAGAKSLPVTVTDAEGRSGSTSIALTVEMPPPVNDHVVISQIYGAGGNSGALYNRDFVELYNPTTTTFDVTGWSIQYASATGSVGTLLVQSLAGPIAPGQYYLIAFAAGTNGDGAALPDPNTYADINISGSAGKLALVRDSVPLSGTCPYGDSRIVDYVGYGSTASCSEGSPAPAPSNNQSALFRKNDGATDTNNNGLDFVNGAPNPRRTADIVEIGPRVVTVDLGTPKPSDASPVDASITVNFSEPVNVDDAWFHVLCLTSGPHDAALTATNATQKSWVITPLVAFASGEKCSVTIVGNAVHDVDLDDGPGNDTLPADFTWNFTAVTLTPEPESADVHLMFGNPSGAQPDAINSPNNYLMMKPDYAESYNRDRGGPNWVSWHLTNDWSDSNTTRRDTFRPDPSLPADWYHVQAFDFSSTGYDRGHMCPSADRLRGASINDATFLMTNMVPQAPANNQGPWENFESYLRSLLPANELYIVSGGAGSSGTVANGHVTVPASTWKVVLVLPKLDGDDVARVTAATRTIAINIPNVDTTALRNSDWPLYLTTVDAIEQLTGYDFFSNVDPIVQNAIEAGTNGVNPPGVADQSVSVDEDGSRSFNLVAVNSSGTTPVFTVVTQPAHGALTAAADGSASYTPAPDFNGSDSFTFRASDANGTSNAATATITVLEVNDPPIATDDAKSTNEDTVLTFDSADLVANDAAGPANEHQNLWVSAVTATATTHGAVSLSGNVVTYVPAANYNGPASFTYTVCDDGVTRGLPDPRCADGTVNVTVVPVNDPPSVAISVAPAGVEGSAVAATAAVTDVDDDTFTYAWSVTKNAAPFAAGTSASFTFTPDDNGTYVVAVTVSDPHGATGTDSKSVTVSNAAPSIVSVSGPSKALQLGTAATILVNYNDPGTADTHTALFTWDDGSSSTAACAAGVCSATHTFATTGVYDVAVTVSDDDGASAAGRFDYVIVTDVNGGSVTGGGWIDAAGEKVTFAISAQYLKSGSTAGNTEVQIHGLRFKATSIDWLVVSGPNAQYTGTGTWNGSGNFGYEVTAQDGDAIARGNVDKFRIRIWDNSTGNVVFDNVPVASNDIDSANPQAIGGGSIVVH